MTHSLFRNEVMQPRQARWLGSIVLGQPLPTWLLTALAGAAAAAVLMFLVFADYTRRTRVTGQLVPSQGMASVTSPVAGILAQVQVMEGQHVLKGDLMAVVETPRATVGAGDTAKAVQAAIAERQGSVADSYASQRRQLDAQHAGLTKQTAGVRAELAQLASEWATRREQHRLALGTLDRFHDLRERQYVTELQLQQQQSIVLDQQAAMQGLARQSIALRGQLAQLAQAGAELPARRDALDAAEQRDRASLSQESVEASSRAQAVINAPVAGVVGALLGQPGQAVQPGQPLLSLLPATGVLQAHLLVPSRAVGFIAPGDRVLLRYRAFPHQKFGHHGAKVARISRSALSAAELASLSVPSPPGEPSYRIIVELDRATVRAFGRDEALKPGMLVDADILGERRALWEWALEPLYAVEGW
ncbi:MAG: HlyD family efflux transporter periplasmic adaptor subunit [Arenimonas sp.]|nr:HlyD family efflux transporter periplasmic adaptor subunit [Arenimonas sp.]